MSILKLELKNFRKSKKDWATDYHADVDVYLGKRKIATFTYNPWWQYDLGKRVEGKENPIRKWLRDPMQGGGYRHFGNDALYLWEIWQGAQWGKKLNPSTQKAFTDAIWGFCVEHNDEWFHRWNLMPSVEDVEESLVRDAECVSHGESYEDFCFDLGYDTDSRKAEKIFNECVDIWRILAGTGKYQEMVDKYAED